MKGNDVWYKWLNDNYNMVYHFAFKHTNNRDTVDNLVSDVVSYLLEKGREDIQHPNSYVKKIVYRQFVKHLRKKNSKKRIAETICFDNVLEFLSDDRSKYKRSEVVKNLRERVRSSNVFNKKWQLELLDKRIEGYKFSELVKKGMFTESQVEMFRRALRRYKKH